MYDIVFPVKYEEQNEDLRYSLRSIDKYAGLFGNVWLVGYAPTWVKNVEVIPTRQFHDKWLNTRLNMIAACKCNRISEDFILFNDDFILSQYVYGEWDEFTNCYLGELYEKECKYQRIYETTHIKNSDWRNGFHLNRQLLILAGCYRNCYGNEPLNYEYHGPIIFNREKRLRLFDRPEFRRYTTSSVDLLFQRSLYKNIYPAETPPRLIEDHKLFNDVKDYSTLTENGFFSVIDHLIGNSKIAPNLNQWLDENLGQKSYFEK